MGTLIDCTESECCLKWIEAQSYYSDTVCSDNNEWYSDISTFCTAWVAEVSSPGTPLGI